MAYARRQRYRKFNFGEEIRATGSLPSRETPNSPRLTMRFDSWGSFVDYCMNRKAATHVQESRSTIGQYSAGWAGMADFESAVKLAIEGWPEGAAQARGMSEALIDKITSLIETRQPRFSDDGWELNFDRYLEGEPECMYSVTRRLEEAQGTRTLRVVVNTGARAGISPGVMVCKGAAAAALVQCLEAAGVRCEVIVACGVSIDCCRPADIETYTLLKRADQDLDLDRLVFAVANPASHRRFNFALRESIDWFISRVGTGYGGSVDVTNQGDIYIGACDSCGAPQWESIDSAAAWVVDTLKAQGVHLTREITESTL